MKKDLGAVSQTGLSLETQRHQRWGADLVVGRRKEAVGRYEAGFCCS